jgi:hypothetical protein
LDFHKTEKDPEIQIILINGIDGVILGFVEIEEFPYQSGCLGAIIQHERVPPRKNRLKTRQNFHFAGFYYIPARGACQSLPAPPSGKRPLEFRSNGLQWPFRLFCLNPDG